ncbi:MAG: hypothetical protein K0U41_06400 [Gammaproteobacteria bacterium]|nr:hypothetical protein [Gammaproteobacteria bacterium]
MTEVENYVKRLLEGVKRTEPDVDFIYMTYPCQVTFYMGKYNGYVGIPPSHPFHGDHSIDCDVHGGITFHRMGTKEDNRLEDHFYVGFDTGHAQDMDDPKSQDYVIEETKNLAEKLYLMAHKQLS